jgi:glycosyltransferase 2 family protein
MNARKLFRLALGVAMAVLFGWLTLRHIDGARIAEVMRGAKAELVVAAIAAMCLGYVCRILRWQTMLRRANPKLRAIDCAGPLLAGFAANNVLPFRAGDLMRAFAFNDRMHTTAGTVLATLFVERLLDLLMVILLLALALAVFHFDISSFAGVGVPLLMMAAGAILLLLLFPQVLQPLMRGLQNLAGRLPAAIRLQQELRKVTDTLGMLAGGGTMLRLLGWSTAVWLIECGVYWLVASSLPGMAASHGAWVAVPVGSLATLIPSTPGYVGTFDYFTAQAMVLAGNEATAAAAFALLVHVVLWLPATVAGGLYLLLRPAAVAVPREQAI